MKILHLDTGRTLRGGQQQVLFLMQGLASRGHSQILLIPSGAPSGVQARRAGFLVTEIPLGPLANLAAVPRIRTMIQRFQPDVLHLHDARAHGFGYLANRTLMRPMVVSRRVAFPLRMNYWSRYKYFALQQRFIAVSLYVKGLMVQSGIPAQLIDVVYDCVDLTLQRGRKSREKPSVSADQFLVGTVGALEPEKGHDLLIEAMGRLRSALPHCRCIIAGEGSLRPRFQARIAALQIEDTVQIISPPDSLTDFLRGMDLFVLPSRVEGLGSIILLAMRCGIPVLASNAGGIPELVEDNATGFLFEKDEAGALTQSLRTLGENPAQRNSVIERAAAKISDQFSIEAMTEATLGCYQRVLAAS
ncbi:MAG: glycosyltransferase family 4 protein [Acidobacteriia bacterium]|nr:glycosyltransferase family 4 protein [Terriglobia bacterium]